VSSDFQPVNIETALANNLETSTREEILFYLNALGVSGFRKDADIESLKSLVFSACGITRNTDIEKQLRGSATVAKSAIVPPYNLSQNGRWGGRRRRIELPRPEQSKARAEPFSWNSKATYWLPYGEVVAVPWPIYMRILETMVPEPKQVKTFDADGNAEVTTGWDFSRRAFRDLGDDPLTADLAGSLTEWYQSKGADFFDALSPRDIRAVANRCDIQTLDQDRRARPDEDVRYDLMVFLFGTAEKSIEEEEVA